MTPSVETRTAKKPAAAPARSSRREDQTRETKRRLIVAAIAIITEIGWRRTTVEQIAERAGVAKGTFFVHFKTKEAIVQTLVNFQCGAAMAARAAVVARSGSPIERMKVVTLTLGSQAAASIELSRAVLVASLESREVGGLTDAVFTALYERMIEDAREAIDAGMIRDGESDAETVAGLLMACYLGAALHCTSSPRAKPLDAVLGPLVEATLAGLVAPPKKTTAKTTATKKTASRKRESK